MIEPTQVPPLAPERAPRPRIGPPGVAVALVALFVVVVALMGTQTNCGSDYSGFFMPSARFILAGQPLDMYQVRAQGNPIYPNANGPVGEFAIAGTLFIGRALGLQHAPTVCPVNDPYPLPEDSIPLHIWVIVLFSLLVLGIGTEITMLLDHWQPQPISGWQRLLVWIAIFFNPPLWDGIIFYGHYEQPLAIYLGLLGVRFFQHDRFALSGALLSLAILTRSDAAFIVIPLALVILLDRRWWGALRFGAALGGVTGAILLPFYLHDKQDLIYSFTSFRQYLTIGDGSFWTFVRGTPLEAHVQTWDSNVALFTAVLFSLILILIGRVRHKDPGLYAVIAASMICFSLCIKAIWGYYFAEPLIWVLAWLATRPVLRQRWWEPVFMIVAFTTIMVMTEYRINVAQPGPLAQGATRTLVLVESGTECVMLLLSVLVLGIGLIFGAPPVPAPAPATEVPTENPGHLVGIIPTIGEEKTLL